MLVVAIDVCDGRESGRLDSTCRSSDGDALNVGRGFMYEELLCAANLLPLAGGVKDRWVDFALQCNSQPVVPSSPVELDSDYSRPAGLTQFFPYHCSFAEHFTFIRFCSRLAHIFVM